MVLDLRDLLLSPGRSEPFDCAPDLSELLSESVLELIGEPRAAGAVRNGAGLLTLTADVSASARCVCARCLKEFAMPLDRRVSVTLVREEDSEREDIDKYVISGDRVDVDDIVTTELILNAEPTVLCREDCKGLCELCGADLNEGPCGCVRAPDPRLAPLMRLLETEELI
ncbi:MAG: DUF177 domain-containing protein [Oscillospiraceae bacterium]|jgi:uncharacterized protein|nr:DUF177 domain-containing protein [Oscillospiraceae bacterium]